MTRNQIIHDIIIAFIFVLAWVNKWLVSVGHAPLPSVDEDQLATFVTFVISVYTLIRENPFKRLFVRAKKPTAEGKAK